MSQVPPEQQSRPVTDDEPRTVLPDGQPKDQPWEQIVQPDRDPDGNPDRDPDGDLDRDRDGLPDSEVAAEPDRDPAREDAPGDAAVADQSLTQAPGTLAADDARGSTGAHVDPTAVPPEVADDDERTDDERTDAERTDAERTDDQRTDAERTDDERTDDERTDDERTGAGRHGESESWHELQGRFVDDPAAAVQEAVTMVETALDDLRRSTEDARSGGSTEDLRLAFQRYRDVHRTLVGS